METIPLKSIAPKNNRWFFILIFLFIMITGALFSIFYPFASMKKVNYLSGKYPVLIKGEIHGNGIYSENTTYIPLKIVKDVIDDSIYEEGKTLIITTKLNVIQISLNKKNMYVNGNPKQMDFPIIKIVDNQKYISMDFLKSIYPIRYHITKHTGVIWIQMENEHYYNGKIDSKNSKTAYLRLRKQPNLQSPYVAEVKKGESVYIERELNEYYYVRTREGISGYIKKPYIKKENLVHVKFPFSKETVSLPAITNPVQLSWEAVYTKTPDPSQLPKMPGVNIVSPTWFLLKNKDGEISSLLSSQYIKWAKQHHMQVWALFSNSFNPDLTKAAFSTIEKRQKIIKQLVNIANKEHLDGINIDIENVYPEDGPLVTEFVRELSAYLHSNHKYVSMDITFIAKGNWSEFYEREKLGKIVDYLIVMAYDEHWANSQVAGSVASLPWVETSLQPILKLVPNEKVILGIPFYTRLWKEQSKDGKKEISSSTFSMNQANAWIKEHKLKVLMDSESGQHYVEYTEPKTHTTYKMWLEDEYSLAKRVDIVEHYQLAGIASWARVFADENAWVSLKSSLSAYNQK